MTTLIIELNKAKAVVTLVDEAEVIDWLPALRAAAIEVDALNRGLAGSPEYPRAIACNPDATQPEGYLGVVNTPPSADGMVHIKVDEYEWINLKFLSGINPSNFNFILGVPPQTGQFI